MLYKEKSWADNEISYNWQLAAKKCTAMPELGSKLSIFSNPDCR
jgi:hypothetical protein